MKQITLHVYQSIDGCPVRSDKYFDAAVDASGCVLIDEETYLRIYLNHLGWPLTAKETLVVTDGCIDLTEKERVRFVTGDAALISRVEQTSQEIHISLDEKMNPELSNDVHLESKGFMEAVNVTDFPIRDHKVILRIRRRRWTDLSTGKSFSIPIDLNVVPRRPDTPKNLELF